MDQNMAEMDPLSTYEYPPYGYQHMHYPYSYEIKLEQPLAHYANLAANIQNQTQPVNDIPPVAQDTLKDTITNSNTNTTVQEATSSHVQEEKPVFNLNKVKKEGGKKSNYWSQKITDENFPFYACALCNVSYKLLRDLDAHLVDHKERLTSYDLRMKNKQKKKQLKKEQKKLKKLKKEVKQEEIEIKPEDGYIGNEKAADFVENSLNTVASDNVTHNNDNVNANVNNETVNKVDNNVNSGKTGETEKEVEYNKDLEKIYKCSACNKQFSLSYYLKLHVRSHTDEKPYTCAECGQSFITASKLGRHNKRIHLAIKYQCRICYKIFTRFEYLTRHFDKKHAEDKLEGEPYDYNAILPYLKELEEQLKEKAEAESKPKTEELWSDWPEMDQALMQDRNELLDDKKDFAMNHLDIVMDDVKVRSFSDSRQAIPLGISVFLKTSCRTEELWSDWPEMDQALMQDRNELLDDKKDFAMNHLDDVKVRSFSDSRQAIPLSISFFLKTSRTEELWSDWPEMDQALMQDRNELLDDKKDFAMNHLDIVMDDVKVPVETIETEIEIKLEKEQDSENGVGDDTHEDLPDNDHHDDVKDESLSDEDYFPTNTWAEPPCPEAAPPSPPARARPRPAGPLACKVCDKKISTHSYMRIHLRTHTGEKPYKCYICSRGFITSSKMHRHVLTHSESVDKDGVKIEADVKQEGDEAVKEEDGDVGTKNKAKTKTKKKKGEKKKRDYQKRPHACEFCQKRFLHLDMLQVHKRSHEGESATLKCYYCLEDVADEGGLKQHEATHAGPKPFLCTLCGKGYKRRETMVYHRKNHKSEKKYICDICSKTFNAPCKLQRHIVSHRADKFVLRYECPVCAHMFNTKYHVQMHLSTHQKEGLILEENRNDILAMVLQNARKIPKQGDAPTNLADLIPADERSRVCNICGEVFQHFYYLEEHLKSHGSRIAIEDENKQEERKHICQVCNKSFKLHYYLKLHSFTHTKEKPYICQQCGKGFITKGKLKRHLETHSGLKKYQCHICYKFFTRPSYLRIHVRTIHGNQDYNFRVGFREGKEFGLAAPLLPVMSQYSD
ncbi:zinc finger protein 600-like [Cydia pomonella]|uniref:zinc finger protein 600-like n=1 Tax=Cydia pomonella TaxID=82600 RepID=UPI002ADE7F1C|nr:zinc finger protein 600-like [Cydia pomonella]